MVTTAEIIAAAQRCDEVFLSKLRNPTNQQLVAVLATQGVPVSPTSNRVVLVDALLKHYCEDEAESEAEDVETSEVEEDFAERKEPARQSTRLQFQRQNLTITGSLRAKLVALDQPTTGSDHELRLRLRSVLLRLPLVALEELILQLATSEQCRTSLWDNEDEAIDCLLATTVIFNPELLNRVAAEYGVNLGPVVVIERTLPNRVRARLYRDWIGVELPKALCPLCQYCEVYRDRGAGWDAGHIVASVNGGPGHPDNLRPICHSCNSEMRTQHMTEFARIRYPGAVVRLELPEVEVR